MTRAEYRARAATIIACRLQRIADRQGSSPMLHLAVLVHGANYAINKTGPVLARYTRREDGSWVLQAPSEAREFLDYRPDREGD